MKRYPRKIRAELKKLAALAWKRELDEHIVLLDRKFLWIVCKVLVIGFVYINNY